jgi:protease I
VRTQFEKSQPLKRIRIAAGSESLGVLQGKSCSCYPAVASEVTAAGGKHEALAMDQAHTCGKLVTAPAWSAHPAWLAQFLKILGTRIDPFDP